MARQLKSKCKQCRRIGEKLFLKGERCVSAKCALSKRNYPPGFHGPKGKGRQSDYGLQLQEKQKVKKMYQLLESQFELTFRRAKKMTGDVGKNFLKALEMRLDNVVFRLGFAPSRATARQLVNHGCFTVNEKKVDIPSYQLKTGDVVKIKETKKRVKPFKGIEEKMKGKEAPGWINLDRETLAAKVLHAPTEFDPSVNIQMIVEFYSR